MTGKGIAIVLGALCGGCIGTADSISVIRGQVVLQDGSELTGCTAVPYVNGATKDERPVDSRFFVALINAPSSGTAFLDFKCPGVPRVVRSAPVSLYEASQPNGVDIGRIVVNK
jgi:hypothetical protein